MLCLVSGLLAGDLAGPHRLFVSESRRRCNRRGRPRAVLLEKSVGHLYRKNLDAKLITGIHSLHTVINY